MLPIALDTVCWAGLISYSVTKFPRPRNCRAKPARRMWCDTVGHDDPIAIRCAWEKFGLYRLVYGSDYPYHLDGAYKRSVPYIRTSGIPNADVEAILST